MARMPLVTSEADKQALLRVVAFSVGAGIVALVVWLAVFFLIFVR